MKHFLPILILTIIFFTSSLPAHPPKDVTLNFNTEDHVLTVAVAHSVNNRAKHFIYRIVVELNGQEIIQQNFKSQTSDEGQEVQYVIVDAKEGDEIAVTAFCNISGKKKKSLGITLKENIDTGKDD